MKLFEKNVGNTDRMLRYVLAVVCIFIGYFLLAAPLSYVAYFLALVLLITGTTRSCGAYSVLGINTMEKNAAAEKKSH